MLHSYAPEKNLGQFPQAQVAVSTLAKDRKKSESQVSRYLRKLEERKWIRKIRVGKMQPNIYELLPIGENKLRAKIAMQRVQIRIQTDYTLAKRLRESLYPHSDRSETHDHLVAG